MGYLSTSSVLAAADMPIDISVHSPAMLVIDAPFDHRMNDRMGHDLLPEWLGGITTTVWVCHQGVRCVRPAWGRPFITARTTTTWADKSPIIGKSCAYKL